MITIQQIKADINSGKSVSIYLSEKFLWWTHLESDLLKSTEQGKNYVRTLPVHERWNEHREFCDPLGGKIIINKEPGLFITKTLLNPKHYGNHRIQAFLKAHHQNCNNFFSNKWKGYNDLIDRERAQKKA